MQWRFRFVVVLFGLGARAHGQASPRDAPTTVAGIRSYDVTIVQRAAGLIASAAAWDRDTVDQCPTNATKLSIRCALQIAVDEADGLMHPSGVALANRGTGARANCTIRGEGACGPLFEDLPVLFDVHPTAAITTGIWRTDERPTAVWAGHMTDAVQPVMQQARRLVDSIAGKKYSARLIDFNNDSATTFATVQSFFRSLEQRIASLTTSILTDSPDDFELEVYSGGSGVIRTYSGWFAISGFAARDSTLRFQIDTSRQVPLSSIDRDIIRRADHIIASEAVWNRADNRKCPAGETTWSIYCALHDASIEVAGGFHHRRPAMELVRVIIEERTKGRNYNHRLMGYNNDPATHLADVRSLFSEALARSNP